MEEWCQIVNATKGSIHQGFASDGAQLAAKYVTQPMVRQK
jgi:hypothetical protein